MESVFASHHESLPDPQNFIDCGSVHISVHDCHDLTRSASSLENGDSLPLYSKIFGHGELGRVNYAAIHIRANADSPGAVLDATIRHSHRVSTPYLFSTEFIQHIIRKQQLQGGNVQTITSTPSSQEIAIESDSHTVYVRTVKVSSPGDAPNKTSRRNMLHISTPLSPDTAPHAIRDTLRTWGDAIDILTTFPLAKRRVVQIPSLNVEIKRLYADEGMLSTFAQLEQYSLSAQSSDITLPTVDYAKLNLSEIHTATHGDGDILAAALAARALSARRIYGKTGIMPTLTTQTLVDAANAVKSAAD